MFLTLLATPCKGGFYLGGGVGLSFLQFIDKEKQKESDKAADVGAYHATLSLYTGYGLVSNGLYLGGRIRMAGMDFAKPGDYRSPYFMSLEAVFGQFLTPSTLFFIAPGIEISINKFKNSSANKDEISKWTYGWVGHVGVRTLLTGHVFLQTEGSFLFHNKAIPKDDAQHAPESNKRALRFCIGLGYNW